MKDYLNGESDPLLDPIIKSYYDTNVNLVRTIGVKSSRSADAQNKALRDLYGDASVDPVDPLTWKYYLNLAGRYHSKDTVMTITSLDTLQPITFDKDTLAGHPSTLSEYRFGTRYYQTLVSRYPAQEDLIMGILMPCDINQAISAPDGSILRWDKTLVEEQEYSLIKDLEQELYRFQSRWYIDAYSRIEDYYLISYYSAMTLFMLMKLFNLRAARRHTYEVHSFHIKIALRGYMNLDQYYPFMTRKQALYLYRNLPRLVRYIGYDVQFIELIDQILTSRGISLIGYTARQTNKFDDNARPIVYIDPEQINKVASSTKLSTLKLEELFDREKTLLYGTSDFYDAKKDESIIQVQNSDHAKIITKDVITQTEDSVSLFTLSFDDFVLRHWGYMSAIGLYNADVTFKNPRTGLFQTVSAKAAFVYLYYLALSYTRQDMAQDLLNKMAPIDQAALVKASVYKTPTPVTVIPIFLAEHVVRYKTTPLLLADLLQVVETAYQNPLRPTAQVLFNQFVNLTTTNTPALFYELMVQAFKNYMVQNGTINQFSGIKKKHYVKNMVYQMYRDNRVRHYPADYSLTQFLSDNNLDRYEILGDSLNEIFVNLYEAGTGISLNTNQNQKYITEAMIKIMRKLTSYNLQVIDIISEVELTRAEMMPVTAYGYMGASNNFEYRDQRIDEFSNNRLSTTIPVSMMSWVREVTTTYL